MVRSATRSTSFSVELQLPAALLGEREADEAARVGGEKIDRLGRHEVSGEHEVALVLAVFRVGEHDHAAAANVVDEVLGRADGHGMNSGTTGVRGQFSLQGSLFCHLG